MPLFDVTIPTDSFSIADEAMANPVELRFDQGSTGLANRSRSDIVAGTVVDIINVTPGAVNSVELLWKPPEDTTAVLAPNGGNWQITPQPGTWGTYLIALTVDGVTVRHTLTVRSPVLGLDLGAANESADVDASLVDWDGAKIDDSDSNEALIPGGKRSAFGWWLKYSELAKAAEAQASDRGRRRHFLLMGG